jgi:hypothetical protein
MFNWFEKFIMTETVSSIREITMTYQKDFPSWFLYSLPDGLWIFSYVCLIQSIWGSTDGAYKYFWIFIIPVLALILEIGQLLKLYPGTFDIIDLFFYLIGFFLPFTIFKFKIKPKN